MKDNKLIAEFMGYQVVDSPKVINGENFFEYLDKNGVYTYCESLLRYNDKWDWLMPVIENIDHLQYARVKGIEDALSTRHIGDTHKAVVEFIKTYNDEQ
jgi:hypothetical protein